MYTAKCMNRPGGARARDSEGGSGGSHSGDTGFWALCHSICIVFCWNRHTDNRVWRIYQVQPFEFKTPLKPGLMFWCSLLLQASLHSTYLTISWPFFLPQQEKGPIIPLTHPIFALTYRNYFLSSFCMRSNCMADRVTRMEQLLHRFNDFVTFFTVATSVLTLCHIQCDDNSGSRQWIH